MKGLMPLAVLSMPVGSLHVLGDIISNVDRCLIHKGFMGRLFAALSVQAFAKNGTDRVFYFLYLAIFGELWGVKWALGRDEGMGAILSV